MRKLASVQKIEDIIPIEGADRIELVKILGWQCVAKKGEFKKGDICVYFEIDSFLPIDERYEFLRNSSYKKSDILGEGFRIKTAKMRGKISQGLALPIDEFPEIPYHKVGTDVSEILGVRKWEIAERASTGGTIVGNLPWFIPHTDETRIQNVPNIIDEFDIPYYITTKMDGSSHSVGIDEYGQVYVTGHNYVYADDGKCDFYEFVKKHGIIDKIRQAYVDLGLKTLVVQGEFCGEGIQKNRLKLNKPEWYVFDVRFSQQRVDMKELIGFCNHYKLTMVPFEEEGDSLKEKYPTATDLLERANGQYPNGGPKEGIVIRPTWPVYSETLGTDLSMKVINNKYLLKNG